MLFVRENKFRMTPQVVVIGMFQPSRIKRELELLILREGKC